MAEQIWLLLQQYDKLALLVLLSIEESGIPIPIPGDIVMMYFGYRVHRGFDLWYHVLPCGILATLIGSCILYQIGRRGGRPLLKRYGRYLHLNEPRQRWIEQRLERYGAAAVFLGRLIPGMRCGSSFVAGTFGVSYPAFLAGTLASATVWWSLFLYLGARVGPHVAPYVEEHPQTLTIFIGFLVLTSLIPIYVRIRMGREQAARGTANPGHSRLPGEAESGA